MSEHSNQHFVPQFYFRRFARGGRRIHLLLTASDRVVLNASIKGQCARCKFYGRPDAESLLSQLETRHARALDYFIGLAWSQGSTEPRPDRYAWMLEAILVQRARTPLELSKQSPAREALLLEMFKEYVKHNAEIDRKDALVGEIERGTVRITEDATASVLRQIAVALECPLLISDLHFCVLRNLTDYPFIFSDSPVVFLNTYYRNVTHRGVLGLQTPGLQIFLPLDSDTLFMLLDPEVYSGPCVDRCVIDVYERSDVSHLNALQLHHALDAVYFADASASEYVASLWRAHKRTVTAPRSVFRVEEGWLVDGEPTEEIYHLFEPQPNATLRLSFVKCTPIAESEFRFRARSPELVAEDERLLRDRERTPEKEDGVGGPGQ